MTIFYCDPEWHNGESVPAQFRIRRPALDSPVHLIQMYSCCVAHLGKAVATMLTANVTTTLHIDKVHALPTMDQGETANELRRIPRSR